MAFKDIAKSGMLGVGPAIIADNPKLLQGMGLIGNLAYNKIEDREEKKRKEAEAAAAATGQAPAPGAGMKKGGKVAGKLATRGYGCVRK
jgi:hypothetical protein